MPSKVKGGSVDKHLADTRFPRVSMIDAATGGAAAPFSPTDIASLQLMLEWQTGIWQDSARTTPATATDDPIGSWDDQTANANHATQATAGNRLILKADGIAFNDSTDFLQLTSNISLTGAFTVYAVMKRGVSTISPLFGSNTVSGSVILFSDNTIYIANDANAFVSTAYTGTNGANALMRATRDGSDSCKFTASGMAQATAGTRSGTFTVGTPFNRAFNTNYQDPANRCLALYIFNAVLSAGDDTSMQTYLSGKYSVTF
jgi:hypothetical protein